MKSKIISGDCKLFLGNCLELMSLTDQDFVDLTVTSPPYDDLREYKGYSFEFEKIARELYRITKPGGAVVWVVGDQTNEGDESGTSFRQALYFKEIGFKLADTMIYKKLSVASRGSKYFYEQIFEFMFVFVKGSVINTSNLLRDKKNKYAGCSTRGKKTLKDGTSKDEGLRTVGEFTKRSNIWEYGGGDKEDSGHPAVFPHALAKDHILSWSNKGDVVFDPFLGSGTTAAAAIETGRRFIGSEISEEYFEIAIKKSLKAIPEFL